MFHFSAGSENGLVLWFFNKLDKQRPEGLTDLFTFALTENSVAGIPPQASITSTLGPLKKVSFKNLCAIGYLQ